MFHWTLSGVTPDCGYVGQEIRCAMLTEYVSSEPLIVINGKILDRDQAKLIRLALENFHIDFSEGGALSHLGELSRRCEVRTANLLKMMVNTLKENVLRM